MRRETGMLEDAEQKLWLGRIARLLTLGSLLISPFEVAAEGPNLGKLSFSIGNDFTTKYYFRGIIQEDDGFITQPYGEVAVDLYEGDGAIGSVTASAGIWNSVHSEQTGDSGGGPGSWYEADLYGGVSMGLFDALETGITYVAYTSPNNAFSTVQEVDFSLSIDDSDLLGPLALGPSATLAVETDNTAFGTDKGIYMEFGAEPGLVAMEHDSYPVRLSFPLTLGLGLDDYYNDGRNDDIFGYFDGGIAASVPLAFIPEGYGSWEASAAVHFLALGDNLADANSGDDFEVVGVWGLAFSY